VKHDKDKFQVVAVEVDRNEKDTDPDNYKILFDQYKSRS